MTHPETIEFIQKFFSLNFPQTPSLSSYINTLLWKQKDSPELKRVFWLSLWIDLKQENTQFSDEERSEKIELTRSVLNEALHGFTMAIQSVQDAEKKEALIQAKIEYVDTCIRFSGFLMDLWEKKVAYKFLREIFSYSPDTRALQYLADLSLEFKLREDAHKFITLMDNAHIPLTSSFWIEYYFSSTSSDDRLKALHIFLASEEGALFWLAPSTKEALLAYAQERYHVLRTMKWYDGEFLHLSHYLSTDLTQDLSMAINYWKIITVHINNEDFDLLNEHFKKYVPPEEYDLVTPPKMNSYQSQLHTLCVSLRHQSLSFFSVFQNMPHIENLWFAIIGAFSAVPWSLGDWFVQDWEIRIREHASIALKHAYPDKIIALATMLQ